MAQQMRFWFLLLMHIQVQHMYSWYLQFCGILKSLVSSFVHDRCDVRHSILTKDTSVCIYRSNICIRGTYNSVVF